MAERGLTEDQKRKIEENRKRALELRQQKSPKKTANQNAYPDIVKPPNQFAANSGKSFKSVPVKAPESKIAHGPPSWTGSKQLSSVSTNSKPWTSGPTLGNRFQQFSNPKTSNQINTSQKSNYTNTTAYNSGVKTNYSSYNSGVKHGNSTSSNTGVQTGSAQNAVTKKVFYGQNAVKGHCVLESRETFTVDIGYHAKLVDIFKTLKTKSYDPVSRKWSFKLEDYDNLIKAVGPLRPEVQIEPLPRAILQTFARQLKGNYTSNEVPDADLSTVDEVLASALMPFQRQGVSFAIHKHGRVLIADDMGLGKTIQAICIASYYRDLWPLLVVSPSSVRFDWAQQIHRWIPSLDPQEINVVVSGKSSCTSGQVNIVSYDILARKVEDIKKKNFQIIIMDECHFLKNFKTVRTKAALPILQSARKVILLSGTPALSRPSELFTQIVAVCPGMFKFHDFGVRYCDGKQQPWGWDFSGSSNMAELQLLLEERIMIRRQKKEVLSQLPAKFRHMVLLDPQSIKESKDLKKSSKILGHKNLKGMERRGALLEYFHHTCTAKTKAVRDYILDMLESDKKFIVFAHHQEMLDAVQNAIESCKNGPQFIRIDGRTSSEQRNILCERFQTRESVKAAILSITAANAGLNMAAATVVVFAELFWNPGILVQAEDRAHRLGQQDCVSIHYLVAQGTADDYIWPLIQTKLDVLSKAGLTKDNFSDADTTHMKESKSKDIMECFEESFIEEGEEDTGNEEGPSSSTTNVSLPSTPTKSPGRKKSSHVAVTPSKSPGKGRNKADPKQSHLDQFFVVTPVKASQGSRTDDAGFDSDDFFESLTSDDMLALTDDVDWDEDIQEPDIKKRKM